jgi:hypothetical protein
MGPVPGLPAPGRPAGYHPVVAGIPVAQALMGAAAEHREREIELVLLKQAIDTTTTAAGLTFHIIGALDEFARELIVENIREGTQKYVLRNKEWPASKTEIARLIQVKR